MDRNSLLLCIILTYWTSKCGSHSPLVALKTNINVDIVCLRETRGTDWIISYFRRNFKTRNWCGNWLQHFDLLNASAVYDQETLVVLPSHILRRGILHLITSKIYNFPLTTWIIMDNHWNPLVDVASSHELFCRAVAVRQYSASIAKDRFWNCKSRRTINKRELLCDLLLEKKRLFDWTRLRSRPLKVGCTPDGGPNASCRYGNVSAITDLLEHWNVSYEMVVVGDHNWMRKLLLKRIDVLDANIVLLEYRRSRIFYPAFLFDDQAVYYVGAKATWQNGMHLNFTLAEFLVLLLAAAGVCLVCFCFINYRDRRPLGFDIGDIAMVFVASVLSFSYPVPSSFERSNFGRTVLFYWILGGTSLAISFQSLLTSSATHGVSWEADDTQEKLVPNLVAGTVSVCVQRFHIHGFLLEQRVNDSDFLGHMARAFRRNPTIVATVEECLDRAVRRTHVFFTAVRGATELHKYGRKIVRGKEAMVPSFGSTPVRKDFPLRHEFAAVYRRFDETGVRSYRPQFEGWKRSTAEESAVPLDVRPFIILYLAGCVAAAVVLALEWLTLLTHF
ncbi:uncharacterized protein LOC120841792 [Ixodes scapularis]|uniref:uncharacterized protein LOC120841792 n=1 Tax=Ixodes scapularis TaxID=6945 RepID=UPI001A9DAF38|nr:uncharacterized protein LOC120841792 [Ixodes scapularis]